MEEVRRVLRPWPERMTASAPLLIPALSLLCACAAMDVSLWFWIPCFCLASLPCFLRAPSMGVLAVALAMWAAVYLFAYEREYAGVPVEAGRVMVMEGSVEAFSGKSVLFRPDGSRWLYAVSSRDGACPLEAGERYRIRGEAYPLQAPCGPGWMSTAGTGRETGAAVSGLFPCGSGKGLPPCSGRAPLRMMRPGR